ncbi:MAG: hypothetical protein LBP36_00345 [Oscillospiraceae bacterium]|nr:hypothetical protein [Oscillospiraceae bacterium]
MSKYKIKENSKCMMRNRKQKLIAKPTVDGEFRPGTLKLNRRKCIKIRQQRRDNARKEGIERSTVFLIFENAKKFILFTNLIYSEF